MTSPILFLVFNRPDTTRTVLDAIRAARPARLYVAADGPRSTVLSDMEKCAEARRVATDVDWDCEVNTLFRGENLGCKLAVSSAIDWFFEHEDEGIILEDDCLPDASFFGFCAQLLARYRDDTRIMAVSGDNFQDGHKRGAASYYFSCFNHCWGWATWKRAWRYFDVDMALWPDAKAGGWLRHVWEDRVTADYWEDLFDRVYSGEIDSWAYIWTLTAWLQSGLTILPNVNLVQNQGFRSDATHTSSGTAGSYPLESISSELVHPHAIVRDVVADRYSMCHHYGLRRSARLKKVAKRIIKRHFGEDMFTALERGRRQWCRKKSK